MLASIVDLIKEFCMDEEYYRIESPQGQQLGMFIVYNDGTFVYSFPHKLDEEGWQIACFSNSTAAWDFFTSNTVKEINRKTIIVNYEPDYSTIFKFVPPWTDDVEAIFTEDYFD